MRMHMRAFTWASTRTCTHACICDHGESARALWGPCRFPSPGPHAHGAGADGGSTAPGDAHAAASQHAGSRPQGPSPAETPTARTRTGWLLRLTIGPWTTNLFLRPVPICLCTAQVVVRGPASACTSMCVTNSGSEFPIQISSP